MANIEEKPQLIQITKCPKPMFHVPYISPKNTVQTKCIRARGLCGPIFGQI